MNLIEFCIQKIIERRKAGDSPKQLKDIVERFEPGLADCPQCYRVMWACHEAGLPYA